MARGLSKHVFFNFIYFFVTTTAFQHTSENFLGRLLGSQSQKPLVVFLNFENQRPRSSEFDQFNYDGYRNDDRLAYDDAGYRSEDRSGESYDRSREERDDDSYGFAYLLRSILKDDHTSSSSDESLELHKQALRTALRARCQRVEKCVQKCPPKKPVCPQNCQQVFDNANLCSPPTPDPCNKPRCGKTMPPVWKF